MLLSISDAQVLEPAYSNCTHAADGTLEQGQIYGEVQKRQKRLWKVLPMGSSIFSWLTLQHMISASTIH